MSPNIRRLDAAVDLGTLQQQFPERYPFLLASTADAVTVGNGNSRYDILLAFPQQQLLLDHAGRLQSDVAAIEGDDFLDSFNRWFAACRTTDARCDLPFHGGWFIYLSYETAGQVEPVLQLPPPATDAPVAAAVRVPAAVIHDHLDGSTTLFAEARREALLDGMARDIASLQSVAEDSDRIGVCSVLEQDAQRYTRQVADIKRYIHDGDIFQANLSRRWDIELADDIDDSQLFRQLSRSNPASFACLVKLGTTSIIGSSPERLVRVRDGRIETRPIAGTRPRGTDVESDTELSAALLSHPKERAEHIMLIDLERNDLGRVCRPGSIEVDELLALESWQHVHHIVSNVSGRLRDDVLPGDVLRAVFPGGTITGCPKVRCMQILAEQEGEARGAYTGSLGYVNLDGSMDTNILIRTMTRNASRVRLRAGGGIVADSETMMELEETRAKARGLLDIFTPVQHHEESSA